MIVYQQDNLTKPLSKRTNNWQHAFTLAARQNSLCPFIRSARSWARGRQSAWGRASRRAAADSWGGTARSRRGRPSSGSPHAARSCAAQSGAGRSPHTTGSACERHSWRKKRRRRGDGETCQLGSDHTVETCSLTSIHLKVGYVCVYMWNVYIVHVTGFFLLFSQNFFPFGFYIIMWEK